MYDKIKYKLKKKKLKKKILLLPCVPAEGIFLPQETPLANAFSILLSFLKAVNFYGRREWMSPFVFVDHLKKFVCCG